MSQQQPPPPQYEFSTAEEEVFNQTASAMRFVGLIQLVGAGLGVITVVAQVIRADVFSGLWGLLQVGVLAALGLWTLQAAQSLQLVVSTRGDDIGHLMNAMRELGKLYQLQRALFVIAVVVGAVGVGLMLFAIGFGME